VIAVDTSALMAIVLNEPEAADCIDVLGSDDDIAISTGTVAEALIVAASRNVGAEMARLIDGFGFEFVHVTVESAKRVAAAYQRWGKGRHPAALNFGDCFAYELAKNRGCRLLYVGEDFGRTDLGHAD
jgi:ribonuclease VapC